MRWRTTLAGVLCGSASFVGSFAQADELEGAWATDPSACAQIFVMKNDKRSLAANSDAYGSGFIIEGDQIRGKLVTCRITRRKRDGNLVNLIASCSSDIALSTVQFSLRLDREDVVTRIFPGMEGMEASYSRCPAK